MPDSIQWAAAHTRGPATIATCSISANRKQLATGSFISRVPSSLYSLSGGCCGCSFFEPFVFSHHAGCPQFGPPLLSHPCYRPAHTLGVTVITFRSRSRWSDFHYHDIRIIDPHRTYLSAQVPSKTAPAPLLRRGYQSACYRIAMDVAQLFNSLLLGPNIKVIKPRLPESVRTRGFAPTMITRNRGGRNWGARNRGARNWGAPCLAVFARHGISSATLQAANHTQLQRLHGS